MSKHKVTGHKLDLQSEIIWLKNRWYFFTKPALKRRIKKWLKGLNGPLTRLKQLCAKN
jgi:hypothetical protein